MLIDFRQLFPKYNLKFSGVLHIGANVGEEAPVYEELEIHRQVWFEANPEIYKILVENLKDYYFSVACNYAIGDFDGELFCTFQTMDLKVVQCFSLAPIE